MDMKTILGLIVRHGLTTLGGVLVAHGYIGGNGIEQFVSAGMVLAGVGWSIWDKYLKSILINELEIIKTKSQLRADQAKGNLG